MARLFGLLACLLLLSCGDGRTYGADAEDQQAARVLMMGDSLLAWNRLRGGSVGRVLAKQLDAPVNDHSRSAASYAPPGGAGGIQTQYQSGPWDWVVINGGGNDLLFGCGCNACDAELDGLITADATAGVIPATVSRARADGAQVIYVGYLRSPGFTTPVEHCGAVGDRFDQRLARMAARDPGVYFVPLSDLVQVPGDTSYHFVDGIHPSLKGSAAIAARIAAIIKG